MLNVAVQNEVGEQKKFVENLRKWSLTRCSKFTPEGVFAGYIMSAKRLQDKLKCFWIKTESNVQCHTDNSASDVAFAEEFSRCSALLAEIL